MRGPIPKAPKLRQRKNRASTRATLPTEAQAATQKVPKLPPRERGTEQWHPLVRTWWEGVWKSPMAAEFIESDLNELFLVAELRQDFYAATGGAERQKIAAEIRQQSVRFGLSPVDRRRLQWEIEKGEQAVDRTARRRQVLQASSKDPRDVMKVI